MAVRWLALECPPSELSDEIFTIEYEAFHALLDVWLPSPPSTSLCRCSPPVAKVVFLASGQSWRVAKRALCLIVNGEIPSRVLRYGVWDMDDMAF